MSDSTETVKELRQAANFPNYPEVERALKVIGKDPPRLRWLLGHAADLIENPHSANPSCTCAWDAGLCVMHN